MKISIKYFLPLLGLFAFSPQSQAVLVSFDSGPLLFTYDTDNLLNMGTPGIVGTQLIFRPSLGVYAPADQISYYDSQPYAAIIDVRANAGFHLHGYSMTASGGSYVGDDATVGIHGGFDTTFYGAGYYSGALTGSGPWSTTGSSSTPLPTLSIAGDISVETTNHYSYQNFAGYTEYPYDIYDYVNVLIPSVDLRDVYGYTDVLIGYTPDIFDENGDKIGGGDPIYESQYVFLGTEYVDNSYYEQQYVVVGTGYTYEPYYETIYQTSGGSFNLDSVTVDFEVSAVPLPPAGLLFLGGLGMAGLSGLRQKIKSAA